MDSNFRKYYFKDKKFFLRVMDKEDPGENGFRFKIHVFHISENPELAKEQEKRVFLKLNEMGAEDIKSTLLPDKIRVFCNVPDKEMAKSLYMELWKNLEEPMKCAIFLDMPEDIFVKHGDIEAKRYEDMIEEDKKQHEAM